MDWRLSYDEKIEKPINPQITPVKDKLYKLTILEVLYLFDIDLDLILLSISLIYNNKYAQNKKRVDILKEKIKFNYNL